MLFSVTVSCWTQSVFFNPAEIPTWQFRSLKILSADHNLFLNSGKSLLAPLPDCPVEGVCPIRPFTLVARFARLEIFPDCPIDELARFEISGGPIGVAARLPD